ncbi:MAG TPA: hypothetical protein VLW53_15660 [Candidatus Eisenbacteria bacterium]|nr:hypothetical protein [Candidatus Eisenbacteria bacterium]
MAPGKALGSILAAVAALALTAGTAAAQAPIGPNQQFAGVVNGSAANATVYVVCPGPSFPGQTGHPVSGQGVQVVENTGTGFTGSAATQIVATFGTTGKSAGLVFTEYGVPQDIPTTIFLPCSGKGTFLFTPQPTSPTARSATVTVTFVNIAV